MRLKFCLLTLLSTLLINAGAYAQNREQMDALALKYPEESLVQLLLKKDIEISVDNGKLIVKEKIREEALLPKEDAHQFDKYNVYSSIFIKIKSIEGQSIIPKGKGYKTVKSDNIELVSNNSDNSFYDDHKKQVIHFEGLEKNSIRAVTYERTYEEPRFFGQELLCDYYPIVKLELNIKCPKGVDLATEFMNADDIKQKFQKKEDNKFIYYTLSLSDIKGYKSFNGSPNFRWYMPHVVFYIRSYNNGAENKDLLKNVPSLFSWYSGLIHNLPPITSPQLKAIADSLTDKEPLEINKVRNIFYWTQKNIKYVAFEDGLGGFVPRDPSLVFKNKYGDCKDMAFLMYSMMQYKKINSALVWIGTRNNPYNFSRLPSPITDDHMIACYKPAGGNYIFLDATDKQIKFGWPSGFTQGKQGLIATTEQFIDTAYVPEMPPHKSVTNDSTFLSIKDHAIDGISRVYYTGYDRVDFITDVTNLSASKKEEYYKNEFEKGSNKFFISNITEKFNFNDTTAFLSFNFNIKDYYKQLGDEMYINLNIERNTETYYLDDKFTTPYNLKKKHVKHYIKTLEIPAGYKASSLPENFTYIKKDYELKISYELKGSKIIQSTTLVFNKIIIPHEEIPAWNEFINAYRQQVKQVIVLKKQN